MHNTKTTDPIITRLRGIVQASPDLARAARVYEAVLPLLRDADLHAAPVPLTAGRIQERLRQGVPVLTDLELDIDLDAARELMLLLADAVARAGKTSAGFLKHLPWAGSGDTHEDPAALGIKTALETDTLDVAPLLAHAAAGEHGLISAAAEDLGLDPGLVLTLAQNALKPAMRAWCRQLAPLAGEVHWQKHTCFICGAPAVFAELQENDQVKHLRCGTCGADWQVRRLACACCGNEDHRTLRSLSQAVSGDRARVEACDACGRYHKVIAAFSPTPPEELALVDLETLPLDYLAQGQGYHAWSEWKEKGGRVG